MSNKNSKYKSDYKNLPFKDKFEEYAIESSEELSNQKTSYESNINTNEFMVKNDTELAEPLDSKLNEDQVTYTKEFANLHANTNKEEFAKDDMGNIQTKLPETNMSEEYASDRDLSSIKDFSNNHVLEPGDEFASDTADTFKYTENDVSKSGGTEAAFKNTINDVKDFANEKVVDPIEEFASETADQVMDAFNNSTQNKTNDDVVKPFQDFDSKKVESASDVTFDDYFQNNTVVKPVGEFAEDTVDAFQSATNKVTDYTEEIASESAHGIKESVAKIGQNISKFGQNIVEKTKEVVNKDHIEEMAEDASESIKKVGQNIVDKGKEIVENVKDKINDITHKNKD